MRFGKKLIALAGMIRDDEDALFCDFVETYHIYDYRSLPLKMAATLAAGLRDTSRIIKKTTEAKASTTDTLLAIIADRLGVIYMLLSGAKDVPSVMDAIYSIEREEIKDVRGFNSGEAFQRAWQELNGE